jgi:hypothetical protein
MGQLTESAVNEVAADGLRPWPGRCGCRGAGRCRWVSSWSGIRWRSWCTPWDLAQATGQAVVLDPAWCAARW